MVNGPLLTWLPLAVLCALLAASDDALMKHTVGRFELPLVLWLKYTIGLVFLLPFLAFIPIPPLDGAFWLSVGLALPLEVLALFMYTYAIKVSPLSLTLPFLAMTPLFLTFIPFLMLGEVITGAAILGVVLIAVGGYVLNLKEIRHGWLAPFQAIAREKGSLLMIVVALIYGFTSSLGKQAVNHSSPMFFSVFYAAMLSVSLLPFALISAWKKKGPVVTLPWKALLPRVGGLAFFFAAGIMTHMTAISRTQVAYMISVKRLSLLFGVLYGVWLFSEKNLRSRLAGAAMMLAGFAVIVIFGR